ncbi:MAG TPA: efflux RND transporter periplasmic adaptor subunit [Polyangiales bacterium]|nr:efflux RND transporter periplasmic adaptor subunit [Polyangiales bacterium]
MLPRRLSWLFTCAVALISVSAGCPACQGEQKATAAAPPPPTVLFTTVVRKDVPLFVESIASLDGYINADIRARVRGYLKTQEYKDGSAVKTNQRLFRIEETEYETALQSARAALARAKAAQQRNGLQLQRDQELFKSGAVAKQEIDNASAGAADADGQVASAQAQIEQAQLNLSYTQIRSPVDGVAGVATVRIGNLVGQDGPTLLTTVSQIDPIRVTFPLSELDYVKYPERFKDLSLRDLKWAQKQFDMLESGQVAEHEDPGVELILSDGSVYPHRGIVVSANRQIDSTTGTIQIQALVPNPDGFLRPGQYGRVRLRRENEGKNALTVPDKALISVQGTFSVGVIGEGNKVQLRRIEVGPSANGLRLVSSGIKEGEKIVVEGVQKISDGAVVNAKPAPEATASAADLPAKQSANN